MHTVACDEQEAVWSFDSIGRLVDWKSGRCVEVKHDRDVNGEGDIPPARITM